MTITTGLSDGRRHAALPIDCAVNAASYLCWPLGNALNLVENEPEASD